MFFYVIISDLNTFKSNKLLNLLAPMIVFQVCKVFLDRM